MKKWIALAASLVLVVALFVLAQAEDIIIDVVDGELRVQSYRVAVSQDVKTPIEIQSAGGKIVLRVETPKGKVELTFDEGTIAVTERAQCLVVVAKEAEDALAPEETKKPSRSTCRVCGKSTKEHTCPRCGKPYCEHDDIKCGYRLNPAPTPFWTTDPDGKKVTYYITEDRKAVMGVAPGVTAKAWTPGEDYYKAKPTPTPSPTPTFGPGYYPSLP